MHTDIPETRWKQVRRQIRETWYRLTEDEIDTARIKLDHFKHILQVKYGYAPDDVEHTLRRMLQRVEKRSVESRPS